MDDAGAAQLHAGEEGVETVEEGLVAAPADAQTEGGGGPSRGLPVGVHVAAAEGVDRLLGVADQHEPARGDAEG